MYERDSKSRMVLEITGCKEASEDEDREEENKIKLWYTLQMKCLTKI